MPLIPRLVRPPDWGRYASAYAEHEANGGGGPAASLNHAIQTPNFDRIAADGLLFLNAFVPAPTCTSVAGVK